MAGNEDGRRRRRDSDDMEIDMNSHAVADESDRRRDDDEDDEGWENDSEALLSRGLDKDDDDFNSYARPPDRPNYYYPRNQNQVSSC